MTYHVHTDPRRKGWIVRREGSMRALRHFSIKSIAIHWARWNRNAGDEIMIHRRDGRVGYVT